MKLFVSILTSFFLFQIITYTFIIENAYSYEIDGYITFKIEEPPTDKDPPRTPPDYSIPRPEFLPVYLNESMIVNTDKGGEKIPFQYIVLFEDYITNNSTLLQNTLESLSSIVESLGGEVIFNYGEALSGFTFKTNTQEKTDQILNRINLDPRVKFVEQDVSIVPFSQYLSSGIHRIAANDLYDLLNFTSELLNIDIAIIDSGIDLDHPDLFVYNQTTTIIPQVLSPGDNSLIADNIDLERITLIKNNNKTSFYPPFSQNQNSTGNDQCGHGTHVAGIVAAKDNNFGTIGIVPGAKLWGIKVLDYDINSKKCFGSMSSMIKAVDYVSQNSDKIDIVNLSLGCECDSPALDEAITRLVNSNVSVIVAAGNLNTDASKYSPASHPDVITVSAISDFDGYCGSNYMNRQWIDAGDFSGFYFDDEFARFSNYGEVVDIAAPGVLINSTYINGTYTLMGGTSMAAPYVTGGAALVKILNPTYTPSEIKDELINLGVSSSWICDSSGIGYFQEDIDNISEPLLNLKNLTKIVTGNSRTE